MFGDETKRSVTSGGTSRWWDAATSKRNDRRWQKRRLNVIGPESNINKTEIVYSEQNSLLKLMGGPMPSESKVFKSRKSGNEMYKDKLDELIQRLHFVLISFPSSKVFILVSVLLIHYLSCALGESTAWVRQSLSPFDVEKEFYRFVEATGGNRQNFGFEENFLSSRNKFVRWEQPRGSSSFGEQLDTSNQRTPPQKLFAPVTPQRSDKVIVPRSFYIGIFDSSLPADSPHQKSLRTSGLVHPQQKNIPPRQTKVRFTVTKTPLRSITRKPFPNEFLSTSVPQKVHRMKNFAFQNIGWKNFTTGDSSEKGEEPPNFVQANPILVSGRSRGSAGSEPKPRGMSNALTTVRDGSMKSSPAKPSVPIFTSTFYQKPGGSEPAFGTVSLGFLTSPGKQHTLENSSSQFRDAATETRSPENTAKNSRPVGCIDEEGAFRHSRAQWFAHGCTRHTCVVFRGRHFIETDSCKSEIKNTSYRCFAVADEKANYPHCCPRYKCHPDTLGRLV